MISSKQTEEEKFLGKSAEKKERKKKKGKKDGKKTIEKPMGVAAARSKKIPHYGLAVFHKGMILERNLKES